VANNKTGEQINTYSYVGCTLSYEGENCVTNRSAELHWLEESSSSKTF